MIDDRRKPSSPPPPNDESVEILATDNTISSARRRASRKLRVPNDQVPRRSEEPAPPTHEPAAPVRDFSDTEVSFASSREPGPVTEETTARLTDPEPARDFSAVSNKNADPLASAGLLTLPSSSIGKSSRVPRPSAPPPAMPVPMPEPAAAEAAPLVRQYSDPPPRVIDEEGVVRQVRRKIRSVGTGSVPPPPKRHEIAAEPERPEVPIVPLREVNIAVSPTSAMGAGDDDFYDETP